eukprot:SAG31_NODE_666_length_12962_cov_37.025033_7_plen_3251_part_01
MLPAPGTRLDAWLGHGRQLPPAQPALMACDASTGRVYPVASLPFHEHTPGMVCFDERNQIYYVLGTRLAGRDKEFKQTTHLLGISVLSGNITLDVPFPHRVISIRYDNVNASLFAVVMHSGRLWGEEQVQPVRDQRSLVRIDTQTGTTERVGYAALPPEEKDAGPGANDISVCARASEADFDVNTTVAQLSCPEGYVISSVDFASYGTPMGDCGSFTEDPICHAPSSLGIAEAACLTLKSCALKSDVETFGAGNDPCPGMLKWVFLQVTCSKPSAGSAEGQIFSLKDNHATVGMAALDPVEQLYYTVIHPQDEPYAYVLTAINTETGVVRWASRLRHPVASLELNKRHASFLDALQPPYSVVHYRGIGESSPPELAPWLRQARLVGVGGQGTLANHHMIFVDPLERLDPVVHASRLFDRQVNKTMHEQTALQLAAMAEELAFNQTLGWALSVVANATNATTVEQWLDEITASDGTEGYNASTYNASLYCQPMYANFSSVEETVHELFDPLRCLDAMGVNASTLAQEGAHAVLAINATLFPYRDWVWSKLEEAEAAEASRKAAEHVAWQKSVYDGDTRSRFHLALSAFDTVTGVFYSVVDDWTGQYRIVGINSTDGDVLTNKTLSEQVTDIFLSELPYIAKVDPWSGARMGETWVNVTAINMYATHGINCVFGPGAATNNTVLTVEARFDEYTRTASCITPEAVEEGDVPFELHLHGNPPRWNSEDQEGDTGHRVTNTVKFSYYEREVVYSVTPAFGPRFGGTRVTVEGSNFHGSGTVNELYCIFNDVPVLATFVDSTTATCISPPEVTYNRALREAALLERYQNLLEATTNDYNMRSPVNGTREYAGNGLPWNLYTLRDLYGFDRLGGELLDEGDFYGEMNGPIFAQAIGSRVMRLLSEILALNMSGIARGPASHIVIVPDEDFVDPDPSLLPSRLAGHAPEKWGNGHLQTGLIQDGFDNATDIAPLETSVKALLETIQAAVIDSFRSAPGRPQHLANAANGVIKRATRLASVSFPTMEAKLEWAPNATDTSDVFAAWPEGTLLDVAVAEQARRFAKENVSIPESWRFYSRNGVQVELNDWGRSREGNPVFSYPDSRRFFHDFDIDIDFDLDVYEMHYHLWEEELVCKRVVGQGEVCSFEAIPPANFSIEDSLMRTIEATFPLTPLNTTSLYSCWGLNASTIWQCYGLWHNRSEWLADTPNVTDALDDSVWIMQGLSFIQDVQPLMPIPRSSYSICRKGVINAVEGIVHDGGPGDFYDYGIECGRLIRAPYPRTNKAIRITITEWDVRRPNDFLRIYDGASVVSPRPFAADGADRMLSGTVYCLSGEALLHFHSDTQEFVENEDTGIMEPVVTPYDGDYTGFSLEFEVIDRSELVSVVAERGDGFFVDMLVQNSNLSTIPPETVIQFPNASQLNMSSSDWKLWQQEAVYNVTTNWTLPKYPSTGPAGKYECLIAWREWVSPACCPHKTCAVGRGENATGSALPSICHSFCAPTYIRWWTDCSATLALRDPDVNGTRHPYLQPEVHRSLTQFYQECDRTITPDSMRGAIRELLDSTIERAVDQDLAFEPVVEYESAAEVNVLPVSFEFTINGQQLTSDGLSFSYYDEAEIYSIAPVLGPDKGNTKLLINGSNFVNTAGLTCIFGEKVTSAIYFSEKMISCVSPTPIESGLQDVEIRVSNNRQQYTASRALFDYYTAPNITSVRPSAGPVRGGTLVYIQGEHFIDRTINTETSITCRFGYTVVVATLVTERLLTCLAPEHQAGTFHFSVSMNDQQYTEFEFYFTFYGVNGIYPPLGPLAGETIVMIDGRGFSTGNENFALEPRCRFGNDFVDAVVLNFTHMYCISPMALQEEVRRFDISFSGDQWTQSGANFSYHEPAFVTSVDPNLDGIGLGPSSGGSRVVVTGMNFIDVPYLRCRFGDAAVTQGYFISNTSIYCISPFVDILRDTFYQLEMSYNDQQYTKYMTNTWLRYLFYMQFEIENSRPNNAPFQGGHSFGTYHEDVKRTIWYTPGEFDYTLVTIQGANYVAGGLTQCRWFRMYTADDLLEYDVRTQQRDEDRAITQEAADEAGEPGPDVLDPLFFTTKCDKYGCYTVEESSGCTCNEPVTDELYQSDDFFGEQVACDHPAAPASCAGSEYRNWWLREGCYDWHNGDVEGCDSDPAGEESTAARCCFMEMIVSASVRNPTMMTCKTVDFAEGEFTFDITRNGQDYTGNGQHFAVYGTRKIDYIEPGSGPALGGIVVSLYDSMRNFVNSSDLEIRFGMYEPGDEAYAAVNASDVTLASMWHEPNLWDVVYVSPTKLSTVNPYHGLTARMDVVVTSNKQQYELCDVQFYYSSSSAAMTVVTGATDGAIAGEWASFRIEAREANGAAKIEGGDVFVVTLSHTHPNYQPPLCLQGTCPPDAMPGTCATPCPYTLRSPWEIEIVNPYGNGLYIVSYVTTIAGLYNLGIQLAGKHVPGSPFLVEIMYGDMTTETTLVFGPGLDEVKAGYAGLFTIQARDQYHNNRTVGGDMPSFCVDITYFESLAPPTKMDGDGTCSFCHPCPFPDSNGVYWGRHASFPSNPLQDGSIVKMPMRDECVMLTDDQVEEIITVGRMTECEMSDCGIICDAKDGTYIVQWTAIIAKQYMVEVAREASRSPGEGIAVPNSPFETEVVAGDTSVFGCVSTGQGRFAGVAGAPAVIDIKTADLYGNKKTYGGDRFPWLLERIENGVRYFANEPGFKETDYAKVHDADDNGDGTYRFIYSATVAATYTLDVRLIAELYPAPGEFIVDSPWFNVQIHPAPASADHCEATGQELTRAFAGYQSAFMIKSFDQYKNERTVGGDLFKSNLDGPDYIECYVADLSYGEYIVAYQADMSGAYNLSVTLTQAGVARHIKGSMFPLRVVPEKPRVMALSPRSGPVTGDTLMSFTLAFACPGATGCFASGGPRSQEDFVGWLDYLQTRNMTIKFTAWDGLDADGDPQLGAHLEWDIQGWYDDDSGQVKCYSRDFYRDIYELGAVPYAGATSYATVELKAESMEYTSSGTQFYYYAIPVRITYFSPHTGPDSGYTPIAVEGENMVQNEVTDIEVRCKFGDEVGPQATFVPGTGILLCLSGDVREALRSSCDESDGTHDACGRVVPVPLTVALNGQQFTEPELIFEFYRTPVEVYEFGPLSGPITGDTSTLIFGLNFVDTGIIKCKWGSDEQAVSDAVYIRDPYGTHIDDGESDVEGAIRCSSPRVDRIDNPYGPGYFRLQVALNGMQFSADPTDASGMPPA